MRAGIIDIGSNSIKLLVVESTAEGLLEKRYQTTRETRISGGSKGFSRLSDSAIAQGTKTILELLEKAATYDLDRIKIVATSAVRDADNREVFQRHLEAATGYPLEVLSGEAEAGYIAAGVAVDPALKAYTDFGICDLGGGSLEYIQVKQQKPQFKVSLPLGAVRVAEQFLSDKAAPISESSAQIIVEHTRAVLQASGCALQRDIPLLVGAGGALSVCRAIRAARMGQKIKAIDPYLSSAYLKALYSEISVMHMRERANIPELPPARADILPTALLVLTTCAEYFQVDGYLHTFYNLRFGMAVELLGSAG